MPFRALVCDDADDMRILLTSALEAFGDFEVVGQATNGRDAVEMATRLKPDVMLLDLSMPLLDGLAALPQVKESSPATRVIVMSGFDADAVKEQAQVLGAHGYIVKGMHPRLMTEEVTRLLVSEAGTTD